jgi:hypothetical protein
MRARYAASFKEVRVHEGKLVRRSSLIVGPARHWDDWDYHYDRIPRTNEAAR